MYLYAKNPPIATNIAIIIVFFIDFDYITIFEIIKKSGSLKIDNNIIKKVAKTTLKIEEIYNYPQDIEFAIKGNKIFILQSRPITTLIGEPIKTNLIFEKSITRDWSVIFAQIWHKVYTKEFKKQFGWRYSEVVYEGKDEKVTVYRAPSEHI